MDVSITTMTTTHFFIAGTLFGVLLIWMFIFALLALRPEAKTSVVEPAIEPPIAQSTQTTSTTPTPVETHTFEERSGVEVAQAV